MKIGAIFDDVVRSLFKRPATEKYPFVRREAPEHLRGRLSWTPEGCTGCAICVKDCPSNAIELITVDKASKRFVVQYHVDRCTFCAQCVENCRFDCLKMSNTQWELAALNKQPFTLYFGNDADVEAVLAKSARPSVAAPAAQSA